MPYISGPITAEVFELGSPALLGEGIFYIDQKFYWVDIFGEKIYMYFMETNELREYKYPGKFPSMIIPTDDEDEFIVSSNHELHLWDADNNSTSIITTLEAENISKVHEDVRFNDGKCDPRGRIWVGTMDKYDRPNRSRLYRLKFAPDCHERDEDQAYFLEDLRPVTLSNGLGWNAAGDRMYYIDTLERSLDIYAYDLEEGLRKELIDRIDLSGYQGVPDGLTVGDGDQVFVAMWNGSCILRVTPQTKHVERFIELPVSRPTTSVFGGPEMCDLYITTAMVEGETNSGRVFIARNAGLGVPSQIAVGPFEIFKD